MSIHTPSAKQATLAYLQQHSLQKVLEQVVNKVVKEKPRDPFAFLSAEFSALSLSLSLPPQPQVAFILGDSPSIQTMIAQSIANEMGWIHLQPNDITKAFKSSSSTTTSPLGTPAANSIWTPELLFPLLKKEMDHQISLGRVHFILDGFLRSTGDWENWNRLMCKTSTPTDSYTYEVVFALYLSSTQSESSFDSSLSAQRGNWHSHEKELMDTLGTLGHYIHSNGPIDGVYQEVRQHFVSRQQQFRHPNSNSNLTTVASGAQSNKFTPPNSSRHTHHNSHVHAHTHIPLPPHSHSHTHSHTHLPPPILSMSPSTSQPLPSPIANSHQRSSNAILVQAGHMH